MWNYEIFTRTALSSSVTRVYCDKTTETRYTCIASNEAGELRRFDLEVLGQWRHFDVEL